MIRRIDDLGREVELAYPAARIVSLVPSITESLFALGAGSQVVGITDYCMHPAEGVSAKTRVGGTKNIAVDSIISLHPDLVIANVEENTKDQVEQLEQAGLKTFVTFPRTVDGALKMIAAVAALAGSESQGLLMVQSIDEARAAARAPMRAVPVRVLCPIWKDPYMTINGDTFVDSVIRASGGRNVYEERPERYPIFSLEDAAARGPEVVLLPTEPYHFIEADKANFKGLGIARIHIVEGELLSWYGPRLSRALATVAALLRQ